VVVEGSQTFGGAVTTGIGLALSTTVWRFVPVPCTTVEVHVPLVHGAGVVTGNGFAGTNGGAVVTGQGVTPGKTSVAQVGVAQGAGVFTFALSVFGEVVAYGNTTGGGVPTGNGVRLMTGRTSTAPAGAPDGVLVGAITVTGGSFIRVSVHVFAAVQTKMLPLLVLRATAPIEQLFDGVVEVVQIWPDGIAPAPHGPTVT
jgi:hypothetical protein